VKKDDWADLGIYDLVTYSIPPIKYNYDLLAASLFFWHPLTSNFHVKLGMISHYLLDVIAITGLRPDGEIPDFEPFDKKKDADLSHDFYVMSYPGFMANNMGKIIPL
jgi:hypothetical protein